MLSRLLSRRTPEALKRPPAPEPQQPLALVGLTPVRAQKVQEVNMKTAEWHAFRSQQLELAGDPLEARLHLGDAGEFLWQIGGPRWPKTAEEIYQWCAARRAGEQ